MTVAPERVALLLPAVSPGRWLADRLAAQLAQVDCEADSEAGHEGDGAPAWVGVDEVLADGGAVLAAAHARLVADGATPQAAAKWVVAWVAGGVAGVVGLGLATASAGVLVRPKGPRWRLNPGGWVDAVDLGPVGTAVTAGHPWTGQDGVDVLDDDAAVTAAAVHALVATVEPVVEACRGLARVGRVALWAEVVDALGLTVTYSPDLPVAEDAVARLREAVASAGAPWRSVPDLRVALRVDEHGAGEEYVGRKGGCCLAYQRPAPAPADGDALDERERAHRERFPADPARPDYCSTCSLRDLADCEDRQLFWLGQERAERAQALPAMPAASGDRA